MSAYRSRGGGPARNHAHVVRGEPDEGLVGRIVPAIAGLACALLDKRPEATVVTARFVPRAFWLVEGRSLAKDGEASFRLEVTVTDDTVTRDQMARYHREAFDLLSGLIGDVHPHSNIHVIPCGAAGHGCGGLTQEHRHQHPRG